MGYTHYYNGNDQEGYEAALPTIRKILKKYDNILRFEYNEETKKPTANKKMIRFNGIGDDGHETFVFETGKDFDFCKTARKPYDLPVCEVLLVLKHFMNDLYLNSDGFGGYLSEKKIDGCWAEAVENVKEYGINFEVVVTKERDPYCDFDIVPMNETKESAKIIKLPCFGIVVKIEDGAGSITDDAHETIIYDEDDPKWDCLEDQTAKESFNNMLDGITSMILAHAVAGIDIETPAYIEGIETAIGACTQYA